MSPEDLLKAYEATTASPARVTEHIDRESRLILILAIFDDRRGEWVHDFLVEQGHLPQVEGEARKTQVRKIQRWRASVEAELGLPRRERGGSSPAFRMMRQKWEAANPRPTINELLAGWTPRPVDYSELDQIHRAPVAKPALSEEPAPTDAGTTSGTLPEPEAAAAAGSSLPSPEENFVEEEPEISPARERKKIKLKPLGPEAFEQQPSPRLHIPVDYPD